MVVQAENTKLLILHYSLAPRLPKGHLSALICSQEKEWKWSHNLASDHVLVCSQGKQASELPKFLNESGRQRDYTPWRIAAAAVRDLGVSMWHHTVFCAGLKQDTSGYMTSLAWGQMPLLISMELSDAKRALTRFLVLDNFNTLLCSYFPYLHILFLRKIQNLFYKK